MGNVQLLSATGRLPGKLQSVTFPAFMQSNFLLMSARDEAQICEWKFLSRTDCSEQTWESVSNRH